MAERTPFELKPMVWADIEDGVRLGNETFATDTHTLVKMQGKVPYDHDAGSRAHLKVALGQDRYAWIKAVSKADGEVMGTIGCIFRRVDESLVPKFDVEKPANADDEDKKEPEKESKEVPAEEEDKIAELMREEDKDMHDWMSKLMPGDTKCLVIVGITVGPKYQGQGVGTALLGWVCDNADRCGVFTWVHSSEAGRRNFEKAGFKVIGEFAIELDEYATSPPPKGLGTPDGKWGRYVCRYMKRLPNEK